MRRRPGVSHDRGLYAIRTTHGTVALDGASSATGASPRPGDVEDPDVIAATATALIPFKDQLKLAVMVLGRHPPATTSRRAGWRLRMLLKDAFKNRSISRPNLGKHLLMSCPSLREMQNKIARAGCALELPGSRGRE